MKLIGFILKNYNGLWKYMIHEGPDLMGQVGSGKVYNLIQEWRE